MSESTIWQWSLERFRDRTASADPTPGGGSVAAVTSAFGLGLVLMGLEITAKPESTGALIAEARALLDRIAGHADRDIAVFDEVMAAYRLPKETDADKAARKQAIQSALLVATEAPLAGARDGVAALALAERAAAVTKIQVLSDTVAGADILLGGLQAFLRNVDINVAALEDRGVAERYAADRARLLTEGVGSAERVAALVAQRSRR
jgi:methenyltetrahydrofolate cyclohydrolase